MGGNRKVLANPLPPAVQNDEADAVPQAAVTVQRTLASMLGFRRAFVTPRGPGGPQWGAAIKSAPIYNGNPSGGNTAPPATGKDALPPNKINPDTGNSVALDTRTEDAKDRADRKRRGEGGGY